jgi:MFS family permease
MRLIGRPLVAAMCIGQLGSLLPHVTVPAIMAQSLMPLWGLNATEAGVMASGLAVGYMLAVPVLTTLTDRIDARFILAAGSVLSGLATICFGIFVDGLLSATLIWAVAGVGFAGAYMPGLKALTDRLPAGDTSRSVTLYTASFSVGVGQRFFGGLPAVGTSLLFTAKRRQVSLAARPIPYTDFVVHLAAFLRGNSISSQPVSVPAPGPC